ncbi:uracil phosphoribosyltransferase [Sulfurovum sp.]
MEIFIAQIDKKLNENMFILPGLGDAGDRSYNTIEPTE